MGGRFRERRGSISAGAPTDLQAAASWDRDASERRDFLHRIRVFPDEVGSWRDAVCKATLDAPHFPALRRAPIAERRQRIDDVTVLLREVARILAIVYADAGSRDEFSEPAHRVLDRIGPFSSLSPQWPEGERDSRQLQLSLVAPPLRRVLAGRLAAHALKRCGTRSPDCGSCEVRKFCGSYREQQRAAASSSDAPTVLDLFAGVGGVSLGFESAGFRVVGAIDADEPALKTFKLNHPSVPETSVICGDIRDVTPAALRKLVGKRQLDVLVGGPPCQGFSHVGHRSKAAKTGYQLGSDARNHLYQCMVDAADILRPRLLLMENVPGMSSARRQATSFLDSAARELEELGYRTETWKLNASAYGVPQDRQRVFLVASRIDRFPCRPESEYRDFHGADLDADALPPITLGDAIFDLPALGAGDGESVVRWSDNGATTPRYRRYLTKFKVHRETPLLFNHVTRPNNERDLELYSLLRPGEDSIHAIERYGREDLMRYRRDVFDDKYARMRADRPSKTIVAHLAKDGNGYIHPEQTRSISVREGARLQSFPDDFMFCGSHSNQWVQLGNAVPPLLAQTIARSYAAALGTTHAR